jgi:hypothetical protein
LRKHSPLMVVHNPSRAISLDQLFAWGEVIIPSVFFSSAMHHCLDSDSQMLQLKRSGQFRILNLEPVSGANSVLIFTCSTSSFSILFVLQAVSVTTATSCSILWYPTYFSHRAAHALPSRMAKQNRVHYQEKTYRPGTSLQKELSMRP